jgi:hypothetical protein
LTIAELPTVSLLRDLRCRFREEGLSAADKEAIVKALTSSE